MAALQAGRALAQARRRALGLPWYTGVRLKRPQVMAKMARALEMAEEAIAALPAVVGFDEPQSAAEILGAATRDGLLLGHATVKLAMRALERDDEKVDMKLLRLGNEKADSLARLSMRAAEGEFRARQGNALEKLLERLAQENAKLASKKS